MSTTQPSPDEIEALVATVETVMERHFADTEMPARASAADGLSEDPVWSILTDQLDLGLLALPASAGGYDMPLAGLGAVFGAFGRTLYPGPVTVGLALAPHLLGRLGIWEGGADRGTGGTPPGLILTGAGVGIGGTVAARSTGQGLQLTGSATALIDARDCTSFFVSAHLEGEQVLCRVDAASPGLERTAANSLDQTRPLTDVRLTEVAAVLVADGPAVGKACLSTQSVAAVVVAAQQLAAARRCLELAVEYAKIRWQFGQPIGAFQSVKHACADTYLDVEVLASFVPYVARVLDVERPGSPLLAALKSRANRTFADAAEQAIQVFGAIGYTWEHVAHLYLKRSTADAQLILSPQQLRASMSEGVRGFGAVEHVVSYA